MLLLCFSFHFAHSELNFLTHNDNNHTAHDFCKLVTSSKTTAAYTPLINIKLEFDILPDIILSEVFYLNKQNIAFQEFNNALSVHRENLFLLNNIFLI